MAIKHHTGIKVKLTDKIEAIQMDTARVVFGHHYPRSKALVRGGKFLQFDMPDSTTILIAHN